MKQIFTGPAIRPIPKNVSKQANMVATESGNSLAMMLKLAVRNPELPMASMIRTKMLSPIKTFKGKKGFWIHKYNILLFRENQLFKFDMTKKKYDL